jgi:hypothetical protein
MEAKDTQKRRRAPRAWLIQDGVRKELVVPEPTRLSALGVWMREHPNFGKILDMRAAMK